MPFISHFETDTNSLEGLKEASLNIAPQNSLAEFAGSENTLNNQKNHHNNQLEKLTSILSTNGKF